MDRKTAAGVFIEEMRILKLEQIQHNIQESFCQNRFSAVNSGMRNLVGIKELSQTPGIGIPVRTLRSLWHQRKIPAVRLGHRTLKFDPEKVRAALDRFEVKAIG